MARSAESASEWLCCATTRASKDCVRRRSGSRQAEVVHEGQASPARVEVAQESCDEEMNEACVTNNAAD